MLLLGAGVVALLTLAGLQLEVGVATACLAYTIVIVLLSLCGSPVPAVGVSIIAAGCLNYFFTEPRFSFRIASPQDAVAVIAFATTAVVVVGLVRRARKLGEAAAVRDRLQVIIDTIPAAVWSNSADGSINFINERFRDYAGPAPGTEHNWSWIEALHPEDRAGEGWRAAFAAGEPFEREARLRRADGEYRRCLLRFVPLRDARDNLVEWYAASTDIEDLKRAEEELRQQEARLRDAQLQLAHANRVTATGQLAASIAHEVSQPIAAALTNANAASRWLAAAPPNLAEAGQALGRIIRDGRRASDIIGRIRALVRQATPSNDKLDFNEVTAEVVALARSELRSSGTALQTQLADDVPLVAGDRIQLQQVMLNLILNALEAMSGSSATARGLLIRTEQDGLGNLRVTVQDSGPGLDPASADRLFDPFYTTKPGGMGMGLSICRSIIEAHGGRIGATTDGSRGAVFWFILPRAGRAESC